MIRRVRRITFEVCNQEEALRVYLEELGLEKQAGAWRQVSVGVGGHILRLESRGARHLRQSARSLQALSFLIGQESP